VFFGKKMNQGGKKEEGGLKGKEKVKGNPLQSPYVREKGGKGFNVEASEGETKRQENATAGDWKRRGLSCRGRIAPA